MAQLIQIIDKRIAKFSTKGSPLKPIFSQKDTRNVKLKPLEILSAGKAKNEQGAIPNTHKARRIKVQASDISRSEDLNETPGTAELLQNSNVHEYSNHSDSFEQTEQSLVEETKESQVEKCENIEDQEEKLEICEEKLEICEESQKKFRFTQDEVQGFWGKMRRMKEERFCDRYHWVLYRVWRRVMRKGVRKIGEKWVLRVKSAILIQKHWKKVMAQRRWNKKKVAVGVLQRFWKVYWPQRKRFLAVKKIVRLVQPLYRYLIFSLKFAKKNKAAVKIQKVVKGRSVYRRYRPLIEQKMKILKHKMMLERQATLKKERNVKKNAVKVIEDHWIAYQSRSKLKDVRKYLWTLPYECRVLYFKFQQVKRDADSLKNDVDQLIAKKQGKVPG